VPCQICRFGRSGRVLPTRLGSGFAAGQRRNLRRKFLNMENAIRHSIETLGLRLDRVWPRRIRHAGAPAGGSDQLIASLIDCMLRARQALWQECVRLHEVVLGIVRQDDCADASCAFRVPVRSAHCRGQQTKTNSPNQDGKIKAAVPRVAKPLTWLSFLRAAGRSAVPLEGKKLDFSRPFSAPAIQKYLKDPREQRPTNSRSRWGSSATGAAASASSTRFRAARSRQVSNQVR
jgi:hypothetical protein